MSEETPPPEAAGRRNGADDGVDVPAPERVEELRRTLTRWNTEYYAGDPTVSDADFDAAMRELADLEAAHLNWPPTTVPPTWSVPRAQTQPSPRSAMQCR